MATRQVTAAFKQHEVVLTVESLILQKEIKPAYRKSNTYKQIAASLDNVGLIEPVVVFPRGPNDYRKRRSKHICTGRWFSVAVEG